MNFFTGDPHYGHKQIIQHSNRPFKNVQQMEKTIIENSNAIVTDNDDLWINGDLTMLGPDRRVYIEKIINQLKGRKHLIFGNHDRFKPNTYLEMGFTSAHTAYPMTIRDTPFILCHDPAAYDIVKEQGVLLCGHVHGWFQHWLPQHRIINVGVDVWDFKPVSEDQILGLLDKYAR